MSASTIQMITDYGIKVVGVILLFFAARLVAKWASSPSRRGCARASSTKR